MMFNNLTNLMNNWMRKIQYNSFCFILVGVQAVLRVLISIKNLKQYKNWVDINL